MAKTQTFELAGRTWSVCPMDPDEQIEVECILLRSLGPAAGAAVAAVVQGLAPALVDVLRQTAVGGGEVVGTYDSEPAAESAMLSRLEEREGEWILIDGDGARVIGPDELGDARTFCEKVAQSQVEEREGHWVIVTLGHEAAFDLARIVDLDTADPRIRAGWSLLLDALTETGGELVRDAVFALAARLNHVEIMRLFQLAVLSRKALVNVKGKDQYVTAYPLLGRLLEQDPRAKWDLLARALMVTYGADEAETQGDGDA